MRSLEDEGDAAAAAAAEAETANELAEFTNEPDRGAPGADNEAREGSHQQETPSRCARPAGTWDVQRCKRECARLSVPPKEGFCAV